jgi:hypothetical protein
MTPAFECSPHGLGLLGTRSSCVENGARPAQRITATTLDIIIGREKR